MNRLAPACLAGLLFGGLPATVYAQPSTTYSGPCDASAGVALDGEHFVVANDENNTLYTYRNGSAKPVARLDLSTFLGVPAGEEADIEGAAAIGKRIYWITSHGRNSKGKPRPSRQRLFAVEAGTGQPPTLVPVGKPYTLLLRDLERATALAPYRLAQAARQAPESEGGLNIEGLAATPDGQLLIGLRNPLAQERALVIPLSNPREVIEQGQPARLGAPIELDLGRRGIRSIEYVGGRYLIAAGPPADEGSFALFAWSGRAADAPTPIAGVDLGTQRPEALFAVAEGKRVQLLSDDGGIAVGRIECKQLPPDRQAFRSLGFTP